MTTKRALGIGATCCGECDTCAPVADNDDLFELDDVIAELLEDEEEDA